MWDAIERITIDAAPDAVWAIIADTDAHPRLVESGGIRAIRMAGPLQAGTLFDGDIAVEGTRPFTSRNVIEIVDPPIELAWTSYPALESGKTVDHQIEVHWSFQLVPESTGTLVEHSFFVPDPKAGAQELAERMDRAGTVAAVRAGMRRTLEKLKAAAEPP